MKSTKKKLKIVLIILVLTICLLVSLFIFMQTPLFEVNLTKEETHLELGTSLERDPSYYLEGDNFSVSLSYVDTSSVNKNKVGRYPVYIYHGFEKYTCYVNVADTTGPVISCNVNTKTITSGETISINSLGVSAKDFSDIESLAFTKISSTHFYTGLSDEESEGIRKAYRSGIDVFGEAFRFSYGGTYTLTIEACDTFHNRSEITMTLIVEEPPVIEAASDFYVAIDNQIDFTEHVEAWDFIDEDYDIDDVKIDSSQLNVSTIGDYLISFSGTDSYGLTTTTTSTVHILSKDELQKLINTQKINATDYVIIGAYNKYDSGYYENKDFSFIQEVMLPSIVHIENDKLESFGSGFIIAIDDEFVTLATNEHVISSDLTVDVTFYDGTLCNGAVVYSNTENDIAFIRIPVDGSDATTSLSSNLVKTLRTVHIDESYWKNLKNSNSTSICYNCIDYDGTIWTGATGKIVEKLAVRDWNEYQEIKETIISFSPIAGTSGSALFDQSGRLMGMVRGYTDYGSYIETVAVPLSEILRHYELAFKTKIQYQ